MEVAPGGGSHLLSLDVKTSVPFPLPPSLLEAPATGPSAITLWVTVPASLTVLSRSGQLLLDPGSHFKKLDVAGVPTVPCRFPAQAHSQWWQKVVGWEVGGAGVLVRASPPFPFLEPKTSELTMEALA